MKEKSILLLAAEYHSAQYKVLNLIHRNLSLPVRHHRRFFH